MRTVLEKIRARRGETLTETLVALLIVGLASGVLATMAGAAARLNRVALEKDAALYAAVTAAETGTGEAADGTVTVTVAGVPLEFEVSYYGGDPLGAYRVKGGSGP